MVKRRGRWLRTILMPFEAKGVLYAVGPVQPANGPPHELPAAMLVPHRQTSAHGRRKGTRDVQLGSVVLADFCPRHHWLWITVQLHISARATRRLMLSREGGHYTPCPPSFGLGTTPPYNA